MLKARVIQSNEALYNPWKSKEVFSLMFSEAVRTRRKTALLFREFWYGRQISSLDY